MPTATISPSSWSARAAAGLFQRIANVLSAALEWSIEPNDVRQWLRRLSNTENGLALVRAIDGLRAGSAPAADLEELAESGFGESLRLVAATDDPEALLASPNGRDESALAAIASVFEVDILDDAEFPEAERLLQEKRVILMHGAAFAPELRLPWGLRAIASSVAASPRYAETDTAAVIHPALAWTSSSAVAPVWRATRQRNADTASRARSARRGESGFG